MPKFNCVKTIHVEVDYGVGGRSYGCNKMAFAVSLRDGIKITLIMLSLA